MKWILLSCCFLIFNKALAQQISGIVLIDDATPANAVLVMNMRSQEQVYSDREGRFSLVVSVGDELRFVKKGYDRTQLKITSWDNIKVELKPSFHEIEEVKIEMKLTGDLKKDTKILEPSAKVSDLKNTIAMSLKHKPEKGFPKNPMPSTLVLAPNYNAGQLPIIPLVGSIFKQIKKSAAPPKNFDFVDRQTFYDRVKSSINKEYFYAKGLDEYQLEMFIIYTDKKHHLAKSFHSNFNIATIEGYLKMELTEFLDTKVKMKNP